MKNSGEHKLDTTLGELIVAVSDAALEVCKDKYLAYLLASIALQDIIKNDENDASIAAGQRESQGGVAMTQSRVFTGIDLDRRTRE